MAAAKVTRTCRAQPIMQARRGQVARSPMTGPGLASRSSPTVIGRQRAATTVHELRVTGVVVAPKKFCWTMR